MKWFEETEHDAISWDFCFYQHVDEDLLCLPEDQSWLLCCYTHEIVHENKGTADSSHTLQHLLRHLRFFCHTEQTDMFPV